MSQVEWVPEYITLAPEKYLYQLSISVLAMPRKGHNLSRFACLDLDRETRTGIPEVILAEGKQMAHLNEIVQTMLENKGRAVIYLHFVESVPGENDAERKVLKVYDRIRCAPSKRLKKYITSQFGEDSYWFDYGK